jgi:hypothetical protein
MARRARDAWGRLGPGVRLAGWLLLTLRVGLGAFAVVALHLRPSAPAGGAWADRVIGGGEPWSELLSSWQRWDALWLQRIAEDGYRAGDGSTAFYPLYPILTRGASLVLGGQTAAAGLLVASAAFLVAVWLLYRVARLEAGARVARLAVLLMALFPTGFFLVAPYTESLFLALTLAAFWLARTGHPWAAGAAGFGAALTRAQGAFLVLPLTYEYLRRRDERGDRPGWALLAATLPPLGFIGVTAYHRLVVGEGRSSLGVLGLWGYRVVTPPEAVSASWAHVARQSDPIEGLNLLCLLGFAGLAVLGLRRLPLAYALYVWPSLVLLFTRQMDYSPLMSVSRYTLVLFPCFIVLAQLLSGRPWLAYAWLIVSAFFLALLFDYHVHWGFVA